jgi:predicted ArsR family transcriptional regulator
VTYAEDMSTKFDQAAERLGVLADRVRRTMYQFVRDQPGPVTREQVAAGTGTSVKLAAFHLEKLLERGLLRAHYQRPGSRPEGGRPAKLYEPAREEELAVSLPERRYDLMGEILAGAAAAAGDEVRDRAQELAYRRGFEAGEEYKSGSHLRRPARERTMGAATAVLRELGFEPQPGPDGETILRNCPFDALSEREPAVVCGVNQALVKGVLDGLGGRGVTAALDRGTSRCCVVLR